MAKAGLPVRAPGWLLLVAVACWVACTGAVAISLYGTQQVLHAWCPVLLEKHAF